MRTAVPVILALLAACTTSDPEGYDVTLSGDGKADEIGGLKVRWELGDRHDWFEDGNPELRVTVARRGGTLMLLDADVAELEPFKADGTANFTAGQMVNIGIETSATTVELGFSLADGAALAEGRLVPVRCGNTQIFKSLALDFAQQQLLVDGTTRIAFADCGITLDPKDAAAFRASTFVLLGVPVRTTDGSTFAGSYTYKHTVTVR